MQVHDFEGFYLAELEELRSVEAQLTDHLAEMASRANDKDLSKAIKAHQEQTEAQRDELNTLLKVRGRQVDAHEDASMQAIIAEAKKWNDMIVDDTLQDAALVASLQRMKHYEMAVLGALGNWARKLGQGEDEAALSRMLEQTKEAEATFGTFAENALKQTALD